MGYIQKILLTTSSIGLAIFIAGIMTYFIYEQNIPFDYEVLIPYFISGICVCSFIFHLKTLKFYRLKHKNIPLPVIEKIYWIMDVVFGLTFLILSFWWLLELTKLDETLRNQQKLILFVFIVPMFVLGLWTLIEVIMLHRLVRARANLNKFPEIDDIKGNDL